MSSVVRCQLLAAARNTVMLADVTNPLQENAFQEIFPSFVRVGCVSPTTCKQRHSHLCTFPVHPTNCTQNAAAPPAQSVTGQATGCPLNASYILRTLAAVVTNTMGANGYLRQGGGGIETAGGAQAVNDMLLQSSEGFLRFFPVWPAGEDAAFNTLRAVGAFLVSASLEGELFLSAVSCLPCLVCVHAMQSS